MKSIVDDLFKAAFGPGRTNPRSKEYRQGFRHCLEHKAAKAAGSTGKLPTCPYQPGAVEFDAYFAGWEEAGIRWELFKMRG
jgi:hypothetical protein